MKFVCQGSSELVFRCTLFRCMCVLDDDDEDEDEDDDDIPSSDECG